MRKKALLAAALIGGATPANAAEFYRATFRAFGTQTVLDSYQCSPGTCTSTTSEQFITFGAALSTVSRTDAQWILSGYSQISRVGGTVTLNYENGTLVSSEFAGTSDFRDGLSQVTGSYAARNFAIEDVSTSGVVRVIAPVPEPTTWAMMLAGFAGVGLSLRRRKAQAARAVKLLALR